ncbi:MAG: hypothetical protein GX414_08260 [Acidobacteria bacterium]|nr:hypothetical protein [Acidobacteriota bacterium]
MCRCPTHDCQRYVGRALLAAFILIHLADRPAEASSPRLPGPQPRTIHVFVALCDNRNQGIVPVPAVLGDGDDPARNLYWGARYGVRTYLERSPDWRRVAAPATPGGPVLERRVFRHALEPVWLVADAYRGAAIRQAVEDFLAAAAGAPVARVTVADGGEPVALPLGGGAGLVVYVGHNGLMDLRVDPPQRRDARRREAMVLACASRGYFREPLRRACATARLWTTGLLAPEAYVLEAAVAGWIAGESAAAIRERAARAYHCHQRCGLAAARRLFAAEEAANGEGENR